MGSPGPPIGPPAPAAPEAVTDPIALLARLPPPVPGRPLIVGVDGFSGSGKTTLAAALGGAPGVEVVSIETFYEGWTGLAAGVGRALEQLVLPLRAGETPVRRPWDWDGGVEGPPTPHSTAADVVVLEGCGAGADVLRRHQDLTVWVHAAPAERDRRLRARADWPVYAPHRAGWEAQEQSLASRERTAAGADVVVRMDPDGGAVVLGPATGGDDWVPSAP